jgi:hypothetical protein
MFCPECGTENTKAQKFCTRCGTSLLAIEYARSIVNEITAGKPTHQIEGSTVLKIVTAISILGFLFVTLGTIFLSLIFQDHHGPPIGLFFGISGLIALVVIIKQLLKLIDRSEKPQPATIHLQATTNPLSATHNRTLTEGSQPYYSVTEERTRQLEKQ